MLTAPTRFGIGFPDRHLPVALRHVRPLVEGFGPGFNGPLLGG